MTHPGIAVAALATLTATGPLAEAPSERGRLSVAVTAIDAEELERMSGPRQPSDFLSLVVAGTGGTAEVGTVRVGGSREIEMDWPEAQRIEVVAGARSIVFGTGGQAARVCVERESEAACRPVGDFSWEPDENGQHVEIDLAQNALAFPAASVDMDRSGSGLFGTPIQTLMVRVGARMNRLHEESLDGFCDGAPEPCDVTTSQIGFELAIEGRFPLTEVVTTGLSIGWTDLDGAEIQVGDGPDMFEGYFRARALYAQASFYFDVLDDYPMVRPFALLGAARWSAESGSSLGDQSFAQDDSGTSIMYGAGVTYTDFGPGELALTVRRMALSSHEHMDSPVDNSVT